MLEGHGLLRPRLVYRHGRGRVGACFLKDRLLRKGVRLRWRQVVDRGLVRPKLLLWSLSLGGNHNDRRRRWRNKGRGHAMHRHRHLRLAHGGKSHNRPGHSGPSWRDEVGRRYGGPSTHTSHTRGIDTAIVATTIDAGPARVPTDRAEASPGPSANTLLVRPHRPGNEDERSVDCREYIARRIPRQ